MNEDTHIDLGIAKIGRKSMKLMHMYEILIPSRTEKEFVTQLTGKVKEEANKHYPHHFIEEAKDSKDKKAVEEKERTREET